MYNGSAQIAIVPDDKQLILEAGIPLFEFEKRSDARLDNNDYGYINVRASKNPNSSRIPIGLTWYKGSNAYVRYSRNRQGRYVAYCPDDPDWFNRTKLTSTILNGGFKISKYINELGLITVGAEITDEINFIGLMIHDWVAKIDKNVVFRSKKEEEVKAYVDKKRSEGINVQGPILGLVEKLQKICDAHHKHDWMFSPEYQNEIIPEMKRRIIKKFNREIKVIRDEQPDIERAISKMAPQIISNMSMKQLTELMKKKIGEQAEGVVIREEMLFLDGIPLEHLTINKIRTIAIKEFNIKIKEKTREELISLINEKIRSAADSGAPDEEISDDVNDIVGPPSPEEIKNREAAGHPPLETVERI